MAKVFSWAVGFATSQQGLGWLDVCCAWCLSGKGELAQELRDLGDGKAKDLTKLWRWSSFSSSRSETKQVIPTDCMLYSQSQKCKESVCISSDIENDFSFQWRVKNQNPQAPLFPACLLLVTAGDRVLAWKASYWPYYILIKSKLFSGLEQRFSAQRKKIFAGYFWLWSQPHRRSSEASQVMVQSAGAH